MGFPVQVLLAVALVAGTWVLMATVPWLLWVVPFLAAGGAVWLVVTRSAAR